MTQCSWEHKGKSQQPGLCLGVTLRKPSLKRRPFHLNSGLGSVKGHPPPLLLKIQIFNLYKWLQWLMLSFVTFFRFHFCHLCGFKVTQGQLGHTGRKKLYLCLCFSCTQQMLHPFFKGLILKPNTMYSSSNSRSSSSSSCNGSIDGSAFSICSIGHPG